MNFEWYLALRYFQGKRKESRFLSFIKIMAITGVAVGSAGLLIALSIVHGFSSVIDAKILGFGSHITVASYSSGPITRADSLVSFIGTYEGVEAVQPVLYGRVMMQSGDQVTGSVLKGVDRSGDLTNIRDFMAEGTYDLERDSTGLAGLVLGAGLARELQISVGDKVLAYTIDGVPGPFNSPDLEQFRVRGIYETGIELFDASHALVARPYIRNLLSVHGKKANEIEIRVDNLDRIAEVDKALYEALPFPYFTKTIYERYSSIFAWVDLQESTIPFVISVMIIVAAFNLIGTVLMMVLERTKDIGILKTVGAKGSMVQRIFILEGILVALIGLGIGIGISLLFNWLQATYQLIPLSQDNYYMAYAPVEPHALDFLIVAVVSLVLCALASYIPSRVASKTDPVKVISFGR